LETLGGLDAQQKIMDKILERIRGDSDGSIWEQKVYLTFTSRRKKALQ
jgi:hypothetical protein